MATPGFEIKNLHHSQEVHHPSHQRIVLSGMNRQKLKDRAVQVGPSVLKVMEVVFATKQHPELTFKPPWGYWR
jgi:hypothetical protein